MARKKSAAKRAREEAEKNAPVASLIKKIEENVVSEEPENQIVKKSSQLPEENEDEAEEDESLSEEEDEYGELVTDEVESGINQVLKLLRNNDTSKLLDPAVKFFADPEAAVANLGKTEKEKPLYLKDYHRMNLLSGGYKEDEEQEGTELDDGAKPFAVEQKETRDQILSDIKKAFSEDAENDDGEDEDDDGFLKKKSSSTSANGDNVLNEKWVPSSRLPNPDVNSEAFLDSFINNEAWIPTKDDKTINLDKIDADADAEFDDAVEDFEHAYNFRYEDPNAAEIISYARNQATVRRSATNSRKRQREKKKEQKLQDEKEAEELFKKKKTQKINNVMDNLKKIKEAVGEDINDDLIQSVFGESLLDDDFDDADWDNKMAQIFNDDFYDEGTEKPDVNDIYDDEEDIGEDIDADEGPSKKKSKKDLLKEKKSAKKAKEAIKEAAESIVEANAIKIRDEVDEERGRAKGREEVKFKYREVSPETFGLTTRDILLADDKQLNLYIGMKKFAPYKPKEAALKDKRKYTKKKQLQQWRYETFNDRNGPARHEGEAENEIWLPAEEPKSKKRKHNK